MYIYIYIYNLRDPEAPRPSSIELRLPAQPHTPRRQKSQARGHESRGEEVDALRFPTGEARSGPTFFAGFGV